MGARIDGVIIGIGLNINSSAEELSKIDRPVWPATSLRAETDDALEYDLAGFRTRLISAFATRLRVFFTEGYPAFYEELNNMEVLMGKAVRFRVTEDIIVNGIFA